MYSKYSWMARIGLVVLLTLAFSKVSTAQLVLYDNFRSQNIDPAKWLGWQFFTTDQREAARELVTISDRQGSTDNGRRLHLAARDYASTADDNGSSGDTFGLGFPDPAAINEVSFLLTVNQAEAVACPTNPSQTVTDAEFRGTFFNTEASPTSQIGDVVAVISATRTPSDAGSALTIVGFYTRCGDQYCGNQTSLDARVLGYVQPGVPARVRIKWDRQNHQFIFQLNRQPEVASRYQVSDTTPPYFPNKGLDVARVVAHCTGTPASHTAIDALFGNVQVNR